MLEKRLGSSINEDGLNEDHETFNMEIFSFLLNV